jgi:SNF2 family DNA or RNA helicase
MIRRTASDKLLGQPILLLPKATQQTEWLHFNPIEMEIYNIVRYRAVEQINRESRLGRLNLQFVLVRILRLRQICSHILLALDAASEMFTPDDLRKLEELAIKESHPSKGQERIRQIATLRKILKRQEANAAETIDLTAEPHTPKERESSLEVTVGGQHGLRYEPMKWIERACANGPDEVILDDRCGSCGKMPPNRPVRTSCGHLYCEPCINQICVSAFAEGSSGGICIVCNVEYENAQPCAIPVKRETADGDSVRGKKDERKAPKRPDAFLDGVDDKDILASAKTYGCKSYILNCFDDVKKGENTKVIVFSQFIGMLCILRRMCDQEGWMSVMYYGGMKLEERTDAIKQFEKFDGNCILLSSLKCGGLGLNLTMASRVLNIDPFWNVAIEQQAFGRVHRIGQEKTTNFTRLFVRGTIDERIMDLQEEKQKYIQMLFEGGKRSGFPHKDLLGLFGETKTDEAGNIFIVPTDHYEMAPFFDDDAWERWQDGAEKRPRMEFQRYY